MKCRNPKCDNEVIGRAMTCSVKCRVALHRSVTQAPESVTLSVTPEKPPSPAAVKEADRLLSQKSCGPDSETLEIWDKHKAQHRPTIYPDPVGLGIYAF